MIVFSLSCWISSLFIPPTGEAAPNLVVRTNIVVSTIDLLKQLREDRAHLVGRDRHLLVLGGRRRSRSSLLPPLVKNVLGGTEEVVTLCLAIFAISIAIGSGLAAWLAAGRIILLPTVLGAVLLGIFSFDLGFATWGLVPAAQGQGIADVFGSLRGIRIGDRSRRPRDRGRPVHRAGVRGGAGLGRRRPPRPRDRRRQRAQCRRHGAEHRRDCAAAAPSSAPPPRRCSC